MSKQPVYPGAVPLCEVCGQRLAAGVTCVPGMPLSAAYCRQCLAEGADPLAYIRASVACCGRPARAAWTECTSATGPLTEGVLASYDGR